MFDTASTNDYGTGAEALTPISASLDLSSPVSSDPSSASTSENTHLVFVDAAVDDFEQLMAGLEAARVVVIDDEQNGIEHITDTLAEYAQSPLDSVHIISHGDRGSLQLGNAVLDAEGMAEYTDELIGWGSAIATEGDIFLYGCNVAADPTGHTFVQQLSQLTGADVAASDDFTGQGGDWELEVTTGSVEAPIILDTPTQENYQGTLATYEGSEYVLTDSAKTWEEAQAEAEAQGGNLVTINDAEEYAWLQETFGTRPLWIGLNDVEQEGEFVWASGETSTYTNWAPGQPNGGARGRQDYVRMNFGRDKLWDDVSGGKRIQGIIEINTVIEPDPDEQFSRTLPDNYSGYNVNAVVIGNWDDTEKIQAITEATRETGAQTLRVPGGDAANFWDWDIGGIIAERTPNTEPHNLAKEIPKALRNRSNTNATLENIEPFVTGSGAEPIWVVNMLTSDLQSEIDTLLKAKRLGMSVDRIELGNELYFQIPNYTRKDVTALDFAIRAKEWALAIRDVPELADSTLAVTGSIGTTQSERGRIWMDALITKTGEDNRSVLDVVDAYTLHPYYKTEPLQIRQGDVGKRGRAGEIARGGTAALREILAAPSLNRAALDNEEVWITEHNIKEKKGSLTMGNSWLHALMLDLNTQEFLKDERTTVSIAHVLIGSPQWQGLKSANGTQVDASMRGKTYRPVIKDPSTALELTSIGLTLAKTNEIFTGGTATLLYSSEASVAWRVQNDADKISMVNADDIEESLVLPEDQTWQVTTYTADPWSTPASDDDFQITTTTMSGGSTLSVPGFSKVIAVAV